MDWIVFSYSLPAQSSSSPRVTLWRRLRRLGAISPTGGIYVLPAQDACVEAFQWLAQEIKQSKGQALVMHVQHFEGLTDQQLFDLFREARQEDYTELKTQITNLEQAIAVEKNVEKFPDLRTSGGLIISIALKGCRLQHNWQKLPKHWLPQPTLHSR